MAVERVTRSALAVDGRKNRHRGRDAERHEDGFALLRAGHVGAGGQPTGSRPRRLGNAERQILVEGQRCPCVQKVARERLSGLVKPGQELEVARGGLLEDG